MDVFQVPYSSPSVVYNINKTYKEQRVHSYRYTGGKLSIWVPKKKK